MRADLLYMTQLAGETQARLETQIGRVTVERETAVAELREELREERAARAAERERLEEAVAAAERERVEVEARLLEQLRQEAHEHEEERSFLRGRVDHLKGVQQAALDAGTVRGHTILYWDSVKGEGPPPRGARSMTWRDVEQRLPPPSPQMAGRIERRRSRSPSPSPRRGGSAGGSGLESPG